MLEQRKNNSSTTKKKSTKFKVFVYGTLRKGGGNHSLLKDAIYVGKAITNEKYSMYVSGIPYVNPNDKETNIVGEIYQVDKKTLDNLDILEGHPSWYFRFPITATLENENGVFEVFNSNQHINAYLYFNTTRTPKKVVNGDYMSPKFDDLYRNYR